VLVCDQEAKGAKYRNIKRVYQVFFLDFDLFPRSGKLSRRYFFQEADEHDRLSDLAEVVMYELPKLERRFDDFLSGQVEVESLTNEEKWCIYMKYRHDSRAGAIIERLCRSEEGIMKAEKSVYKVSWSRKRAFERMSREKAKRDYEISLICARERGEAEGRAKGEAEGRAKGEAIGEARGEVNKAVEIAKKMKTAGEPFSKIAEFTGISMDE
jgi:predicted transposase/invertase (TIGR01784 family)